MVEGLGLSHLRETDWEAGETEESGTLGRTRYFGTPTCHHLSSSLGAAEAQMPPGETVGVWIH